MSSLSAASLFDLTNAVAVVTGGATGIGLMAAKTLATNGAKVYITGRREQVLADAVKAHGQGLKGSLHAIKCDVTSRDDLRSLAKQIEEKDGALHILVNNAGIVGPKTRLQGEPSALTAKQISEQHLAGEPDEDWSKLFATNVQSIFITTMALLPLLDEGNRKPPRAGFTSAVINITSISGIIKFSQHHMAYNASKAAANHVTVSLAHDLNFRAKLGIRINALAPGLFPSEMTAGKPSKDGVSDPSDLEGYENPSGRLGSPEDMGATILYLATCQFTSGQVLACDGGFTSAIASTR